MQPGARVTASTLRIGVVLHSTLQPAWVCRVLEHVRNAHRLERVVFSAPQPANEPLAARVLRRLDDAAFGRSGDALAECDAAPLLDGTPVASSITRNAVDVVLAFAPVDTTEADVWSVEQDGLGALVSDRLVMRAVLRSREGVVAATSARHDPISLRRGLSRLGWRVAAMIEHALDRRSKGTLVPVAANDPQQPSRPTTAKAAARAASAASAWVRQKYRDRFANEQWSIAFAYGSDAGFDVRRFHQIVPPPDRLWADPFVIADGDRAWIFVEELVFAEGRGVLAVLEARRDGTWTEPRRILERPYHLSYPCVFRWNGAFYMIPESGENRSIDLYRCVSFPYHWELDRSLIRGVHAVDTTVFEHGGRWWMYFATDSGDGAGFDRLWAFHAESPHGPWMPHRWNPLMCDVVGGRPGGRPFAWQGRLVRAGQVGAPHYGHSIVLREIVTLTPEAWEERDIQTIGPDTIGAKGTHTLNADGDFTVVDVMRFRRRS